MHLELMTNSCCKASQLIDCLFSHQNATDMSLETENDFKLCYDSPVSYLNDCLFVLLAKHLIIYRIIPAQRVDQMNLRCIQLCRPFLIQAGVRMMMALVSLTLSSRHTASIQSSWIHQFLTTVGT